MEAVPDYDRTWNSSDDMPYDTWNSDYNMLMILGKNIIRSFTSVVCILGLLGNGPVIWLLGFRMKRTPFNTYILNLAVADFGVLVASFFVILLETIDMHVVEDNVFKILFSVTAWLFHSLYSISQFLLTTISIDRCVAVLFPLWYQCHRPEKLSAALCALIWLLACLLQGICLAFQTTRESDPFPPVFYAFLVTAVVCLPLITVSTLILFVRFCFKSQQNQRGKLLRTILLALFFFLIFAFPLDVIGLIVLNPRFSDQLGLEFVVLPSYGLLGASLNSFVNPLLYFFIGRKKREHRENLKLVLQRAFTEEEERCGEEPETQFSQL